MRRTDSIRAVRCFAAVETAEAAETAREALREEQRVEAQARTQGTTVTQLSPDEMLADGGAMQATHGDEAPTQREMEQDVVTTNPSVESMGSRG